MKKNILSAAMLLYFIFTGHMLYLRSESLAWRGFFLVVTIFIAIEIIRHWADISRDIILLLKAESPYKCRWIGSGLLVILAFLFFIIGVVYAAYLFI